MLVYFLWIGGKGVDLDGEELGGVGDCSNWNVLYKKKPVLNLKKGGGRVSWGSLT